MHDLPLEGVHRRERLGFAGSLNFLGNARTQFAQIDPTLSSVATDVEHQPGAPAGLPVHREPRELLQRVKYFAPVANELVKRRANYRHHCAVAFNVHVDIAIKVGDVEQALDVVGRNIALLLEVGDADLISLVLAGSRGVLPVWRLLLLHAFSVSELISRAACLLSGLPLPGLGKRVLTLAHDEILLVSAGPEGLRSADGRTKAPLSAYPTAYCATVAVAAA